MVLYVTSEFSQRYCAVQPPAMTSSLPVTQDDSSEAKYKTPTATSPDAR